MSGRPTSRLSVARRSASCGMGERVKVSHQIANILPEFGKLGLAIEKRAKQLAPNSRFYREGNKWSLWPAYFLRLEILPRARKIIMHLRGEPKYYARITSAPISPGWHGFSRYSVSSPKQCEDALHCVQIACEQRPRDPRRIPPPGAPIVRDFQVPSSRTGDR